MNWWPSPNRAYLASVLSHLRPNPRFARTSDTRQPLGKMRPPKSKEVYK